MSLNSYEKPTDGNIFSIVTLSTSVLATLLILLVSFKGKLHKDQLSKLALSNIMADFVYSFSKLLTLLPYTKTETYCKVTEALTGIGRMSALIISVLFGHAILRILKEENLDSIKKNWRWYILLTLCPSIVLEIFKVCKNFYDIPTENPEVCTIAFEDNLYWQLGIFGLPSAFLCTLSLTYYTIACVRCYREGRWMKEILVLFLFPAIIIILWMPSRMVDIYISLGGIPSDLVVIIFAQISHLVGLCQTIIYGRNRQVLREIKKTKYICLRRKEPEAFIPINSTEPDEEEEKSLKASLLRRRTFRTEKSDSTIEGMGFKIPLSI